MKLMPPPAELRNLTDKLLDQGNLTRPEMARLEEFLEDDAHLAYYLDVTQQDAFLPSVLAENQVTARPKTKLRLFVPLGLAAAACAIFFVGLQVGRSAKPVGITAVPEKAAPPARVTGLMGVEWAGDSVPDLVGTSGVSRRLAFDSGLIEITYSSGVRVTLEGPADFDIMSPDSGRLTKGKLVADVPKGAEGFRVDYRDGTVVDLGTEFAMEVKSTGPTEVGVFDGEVEIHREGVTPMALFQNHAVIHDSSDARSPIQVVPFDREKYVRQLPSREFAWEINSEKPSELVFDVSHLLWKPSEFRAIFKWINGLDGIVVENVELRLDGRRIAMDKHQGQTGVLSNVRDNIFRLDVPSAAFRHGVWTVHALAAPMPRLAGMAAFSATPVRSLGILQFDEGLVTTATRDDFIGRWSYRYLGQHFVREFHTDGTVSLTCDGKPMPGVFKSCTWTVSDGILRLNLPHLKAVEDHVLRDRDTLIFTARPYENATREIGSLQDG